MTTRRRTNLAILFILLWGSIIAQNEKKYATHIQYAFEKYNKGEKQLSSDTLDFFITSTLVRRLEKSKQETFTIIDPKKMTSTHYFEGDNNQSLKKTSHSLLPSKDKWETEYSVNIKKGEKKNILGYSCYKIDILATYSSLADKEIKKTLIELFVTKELPFSSHYMIGVEKPVMNKCALEIRETNLQTKGTTSYKALYVKKLEDYTF